MNNHYKKVIVHYSAIFTAAAAFLSSGGSRLALVFIPVVVHELGHYIAIRLSGDKLSAFLFHMGGINMQMSNRGSYPATTALAISLAGPLFNLVFAALMQLCGMTPLVMPSLALGVCNLLPALPLDGGNACYTLLSGRIGRKAAKKVIKPITVCIGVLLMIAGIFALQYTSYNFSLLLLGIFIVYSAKRSGINPILESELFYIKKGCCPAKLYFIRDELSPMKAAGYLPADGIGAVIDKSGNISRFLTSRYIYFKMEKKGSCKNLHDFIENE